MRDFWESYRTRDFAKFCEVVYSVESRVLIDETDPRVRQLLVDALRWARAHPEAVLEKRSESDSPNVVAFSLLMNALHGLLEGTGLRVARFVHDEQNQFMRSFRETYAVKAKRTMTGSQLAKLRVGIEHAQLTGGKPTLLLAGLTGKKG